MRKVDALVRRALVLLSPPVEIWSGVLQGAISLGLTFHRQRPRSTPNLIIWVPDGDMNQRVIAAVLKALRMVDRLVLPLNAVDEFRAVTVSQLKERFIFPLPTKHILRFGGAR